VSISCVVFYLLPFGVMNDDDDDDDDDDIQQWQIGLSIALGMQANAANCTGQYLSHFCG